MKTCRNCGAAVKDEAKFCQKCGHSDFIVNQQAPQSYVRPNQQYDQFNQPNQFNQPQQYNQHEQFQPNQYGQPNGYNSGFTPTPQPTPPKKKTPWLAIIIVVLAIAVVVAAVVMVLGNKDDTSEKEKDETSTSETSELSKTDDKYKIEFPYLPSSFSSSSTSSSTTTTASAKSDASTTTTKGKTTTTKPKSKTTTTKAKTTTTKTKAKTTTTKAKTTTTTRKKVSYTIGRFSGNTYINEWANIKVAIPSSWEVEDKVSSHAESDVAFIAREFDKGLGIEFIKNSDNLTESELLDILIKGLQELGLKPSTGTSARETIGGESYLSAIASINYDNVKGYVKISVRSVDGRFIVMHSMADRKSDLSSITSMIKRAN